MVHEPNVAVVVDSSCCLPANLLQEWNITVAPHELIVDGRSYRDGIDILPAEFYGLLKSRSAALSTAAPQPGRFLEAFAAAAKLAPNILCITLSASFSVTYRAAMTAKSAFERNCVPGEARRVEVMDSQAAAGASGLVALAAARWAAQGRTLVQIMNGVDALAPRVNLLAYLDTLLYLQRLGRVGKLQTWAGSMLGVKPLVQMKMGEARILSKPFSRPRATQRLLEVMRLQAGSDPVVANVMEAGAAANAQELLSGIKNQLNCSEAFVSQFTPVMGAHTGPGLLGVAFHTDPAGLLPPGN